MSCAIAFFRVCVRVCVRECVHAYVCVLKHESLSDFGGPLAKLYLTSYHVSCAHLLTCSTFELFDVVLQPLVRLSKLFLICAVIVTLDYTIWNRALSATAKLKNKVINKQTNKQNPKISI